LVMLATLLAAMSPGTLSGPEASTVSSLPLSIGSVETLPSPLDRLFGPTFARTQQNPGDSGGLNELLSQECASEGQGRPCQVIPAGLLVPERTGTQETILHTLTTEDRLILATGGPYRAVLVVCGTSGQVSHAGAS
jgi:hypothetical protein